MRTGTRRRGWRGRRRGGRGRRPGGRLERWAEAVDGEVRGVRNLGDRTRDPPLFRTEARACPRSLLFSPLAFFSPFPAFLAPLRSDPRRRAARGAEGEGTWTSRAAVCHHRQPRGAGPSLLRHTGAGARSRQRFNPGPNATSPGIRPSPVRGAAAGEWTGRRGARGPAAVADSSADGTSSPKRALRGIGSELRGTKALRVGARATGFPFPKTGRGATDHTSHPAVPARPQPRPPGGARRPRR